MFGNGAAYCTLTNPTVVISLSGCWAAVCALNKKREVRKIIYQHVGPGPQCNLMACSGGHMYCRE